jgi:hypothetical protein
LALYTVSTGGNINAGDVDQLVYVLQRQSGQTETGRYLLDGWANASTDTISQYMQSLSRTSTPVSVSIDTATQSPTGVNSPTANNLSANGFFVYTTSTGAGVSVLVGGNFTIQF